MHMYFSVDNYGKKEYDCQSQHTAGFPRLVLLSYLTTLSEQATSHSSAVDTAGPAVMPFPTTMDYYPWN